MTFQESHHHLLHIPHLAVLNANKVASTKPTQKNTPANTSTSAAVATAASSTISVAVKSETSVSTTGALTLPSSANAKQQPK
ncbi:hypothetical protein PCANC_14134 [Puccinia coronata f. sp. avenae]|uniref:Uncharacterized protein n=1 Tax=Puccinia coronata f. sp. avenae TaxID=200324 RepID=A0A2N5SVQ1_9BASI|nr:hypothetical protein PCANC_14134 [Puccinia coronata f. sp. avenae]